jgi:hypothetical protein
VLPVLAPVDESLKAAGEIVIDKKTSLRGKDLIGCCVTKKYGGAFFNGIVKSYQNKPKNKYPIATGCSLTRTRR